MYAEVNCPGCGHRLRVPAEQAGKQAVCAICRQVFELQGDTAAQPVSNPELNPYDAPQVPTATLQPRGQVAPHRGGVVLALAIVGWVVCPIVSVIAWLMGRGDLQMMNRGAMDSGGRSITQAGTIVALIHCLLMLLGLIGFVIALLVAGVAGIANM